MVEKNAVIEETMLGFNARGIFTCEIHVRYGDSMFALCGGTPIRKTLIGDVISIILKFAGVYIWDNLKERIIRIRLDDEQRVIALGDLFKEEWLNLDEYFGRSLDD